MDENDAKELYQLANDWQNNKIDPEGEEFKAEQIDENLAKNVAFFAQTQISPACSYWGGIITQ